MTVESVQRMAKTITDRIQVATLQPRWQIAHTNHNRCGSNYKTKANEAHTRPASSFVVAWLGFYLCVICVLLCSSTVLTVPRTRIYCGIGQNAPPTQVAFIAAMCMCDVYTVHFTVHSAHTMYMFADPPPSNAIIHITFYTYCNIFLS